MRLELTREGDYAVRSMLALARHDSSEPLSSRVIALEWEIPPRYLVQILGRLASRGLVEAVAGRRGGYRLARPAHEVQLLEIVEAIHDVPADRRCVLRGGPCQPDGHCLVHEAFSAARDGFRETLAGWSLAQLIRAGTSGAMHDDNPSRHARSRALTDDEADA